MDKEEIFNKAYEMGYDKGRAEVADEFIDKFIKRTQLRQMTKAECINTMYVLADEIKENNK